MRLALVGASGRMGRAIARLAHGEGIEIVCAVGVTDVGRDVGELAGVGPIGTSVVDGLAALEHAAADVVIDFSAPAVALALAPVAAAAKSAIVSGTTGLTAPGRDALARAAERVPVLWEPNMSLGVHVLSRLVSQAVGALADWDIEIVETHHRGKVDAPSGTALRLAEAAQRARTAGTRLVHGRQGQPGARAADEIGMHALRGGDVIGDHTAHLFGGGERIELTHRATSRDVFAHGALRAARWIAGKPARTYSLATSWASGTRSRSFGACRDPRASRPGRWPWPSLPARAPSRRPDCSSDGGRGRRSASGDARPPPDASSRRPRPPSDPPRERGYLEGRG